MLSKKVAIIHVIEMIAGENEQCIDSPVSDVWQHSVLLRPPSLETTEDSREFAQLQGFRQSHLRSARSDTFAQCAG